MTCLLSTPERELLFIQTNAKHLRWRNIVVSRQICGNVVLDSKLLDLFKVRYLRPFLGFIRRYKIFIIKYTILNNNNLLLESRMLELDDIIPKLNTIESISNFFEISYTFLKEVVNRLEKVSLQRTNTV